MSNDVLRLIESSTIDGLCVLRLNAPPLNMITLAGLTELRDAIVRANASPQVERIVIIGDAKHFSAGADIRLFQEINCREDAVRISRVFQEAFQAVEDSEKPVAAAVAGRVMGGALELAMACHWRVCTRHTKFSMPEVRLGINPAAGGTQRLPRLVGPEAALGMLLTAETVDASTAEELGLVDAVCSADQLLDTARDLLESQPTVRRTRRYGEKVEDEASNEATFRQADELAGKTRPEIIAPRRIVEVVRRGLQESFAAGLLAEQDAFAQCMDTRVTQNKLHLFFATRQTGKIAELDDTQTADVTQAAVIGMGSMGTGIAHALIIAGVHVIAYDEDDAASQRGTDKIRRSVEKRVADGKLAHDRAETMLGLLWTTTDVSRISDAPLVIEAVFEDVSIKRTVLAKIEQTCSAETIIATNTSTISLDVLAEQMHHPDRLVGMHFFNPAQRMPLVEVIQRDATSRHVVATAMDFVKRIRKTPVLVRNREGFLVNRVFIPYLKEAFWLLEEGIDPPAIDAAMVEFGFPMGPLTLIDMAGLDVLVLTDRVMNRTFPRHGTVSDIAIRLVDAGHLGQKTGSGVYKYERGDYAPKDNDAAERIIAEVRREKNATTTDMTSDQIARRLVLRMVNEAFYVIEEGVARSDSDIDVATVLGTGFPDFRGGLMTYARQLGLAEVRNQLEALAERFGERFLPSDTFSETKGN